MSQYEDLAPYYDILTRDVDYCAFADYYEAVFKRYGISPKLVLDLACGTGALTWEMARRGYEMIGVDISSAMLAEARHKADSVEFGIMPVFVNQSLEMLDLYGTVEAAVCCLDGMNYIPEESIGEVFKRINLFIEPGGVFVFDINSPYKLKNMDGDIFIDETDDVFCVWRSDYSEADNCCFYGMDVFTRCGEDRWERMFEEHVEYIYEPEKLKELLEEHGFCDVCIFGEMSFEKPPEDEQRIFIAARNTRYQQ